MGVGQDIRLSWSSTPGCPPKLQQRLGCVCLCGCVQETFPLLRLWAQKHILHPHNSLSFSCDSIYCPKSQGRGDGELDLAIGRAPAWVIPSALSPPAHSNQV